MSSFYGVSMKQNLQMQADNNNSTNTVEKINLEDQDAVWNFIEENFQAILDMDREQVINRSFEVLYRCVYTMCDRFREGRLVYVGVRQMVQQHIDKMLAELQQDMSNGQDLNNPIVLQVDKIWALFAFKTLAIHSVLLYLQLERIMSRFVRQGEELTVFGWLTFRTEILENRVIKQALTNGLVFNPENGIQRISLTNSLDDDELGDYKESPLFNVDTIIEIMTFLSTPKLAQQLSTASRQMAKLSDYVLTKRKPFLRPIQVWNGNNDKMTEPFITHLKQDNTTNLMGDQNIFDNWFINEASKNRICLPDIEPPEWLAGVELIYLMDGLNDKIYRFLNLLRNKLQNCQLVLNLAGFFAKMHETGHFLQFFQLFNERCFSLMLEIGNLPRSSSRSDFEFKAKWPIWAIFNNIFFPNCRELILSTNVEVEANDAAKWLMHPSTEHRPRLLRLRYVTNLFAERLIEYIKKDFFNLTGKRMFFVEFPKGTALSGSQQGEWQNGIGEQLSLESNGITRLPVDLWQENFKDFYQLPAVHPKVIFR